MCHYLPPLFIPRLRRLRTAARRFAVVASARLETVRLARVGTFAPGGPGLVLAFPTAPNGLCPSAGFLLCGIYIAGSVSSIE